MGFRSMSSFQYGDVGLDQGSLFYYDEERRYICIFVPRVTLVFRPRLAGVVGFLRLIPAYRVSTATLFNFGGC